VEKLASLVVVAAIAGATIASAADKGRISWDQVGDPALRSALNQLVGPDAIDCGFMDLRKRKAKPAEKHVVLDCIAAAEQRRLPFKFGIARLFIESTAFEVYARSANGQSWLVGHGQNLMENELQSSMERCVLIEVSPRTLFISGMDCSQFKLLSKQSL